MKSNGDSISAFSPASQNIGPQTILLVEDETVVREVTREVLEHAGYHVLESDGPEQALHLASVHEGRIGLLLTDMVMPGMNGADLACRLQSLRPDLVTVFMSGYAESDVLRRLRENAAIHIQKPFTMDALLSSVAEAFQGSGGGETVR